MIKIKKQTIKKIDWVMIALTLAAIAALIGYSRPLIISPIDNLSTTDTAILFSFDKGNYIILDDNEEFSSPERIYAQNNLVLNLKPGIYYWKVEGALSSEVRKLIIESRVELKFVENEGEYDLINSGNVPLNVSVYNRAILTGSVIAEVGEKLNSSGDEYIGRENE
ncbi:MAG: hypothetical protein Q8Q31_00015 [Nanoarchaeota archaeon]|nr:hypothetical protein [Nanoarchaeota archaeon]